MSATRLLVLGAVRIFQPAHGYLVRRELLSWDVENWAAINLHERAHRDCFIASSVSFPVTHEPAVRVASPTP